MPEYTFEKVLKWINRERKHVFDLPPLDEIPKAYDNSDPSLYNIYCCQCPIARGLSLTPENPVEDRDPAVDGTSYYLGTDFDMTNPYPMPRYIRAFIEDFDAGKLRELVRSE